MTLDEVAAVLRCEPTTVVNYVEAHELDAIQIGRERRFRARDVLAFIDSKQTTRRGAPSRA